MRKHLLPLLAALLLVITPALADTGKLVLDPLAGDAPAFRIVEDRSESLRIVFTLPELTRETSTVGEQRFDALAIPGGYHGGEPGRAELPCITRYIALPAGATADVRLVDIEEKRFDGLTLRPAQPDNAEAFAWDRDWYAGGERIAASVEIGEAGILRDLRVAPVTFRPMACDPSAGEVSVASRMEIEIEFRAADRAVQEPAARRVIPESFDRMYRDLVINYRTPDDAEVGPGTYLMCCSSSPGVTVRVEPLLEWRRRQGYNVVVETFPSSVTRYQVLDAIQERYDTVDPPLEYIVLVGDVGGPYAMPCWAEGLSSFHGEGDHYYTTLEGDDILADAHIGRLSFETTTQLENMVDKILVYETDPPTADSGWFNRAVLTADPFTDSGVTPVYVTKWLIEQLMPIGFGGNIMTIYTNPFATQMVQGINGGCSVFSYRGIGGMSGFTATHALYVTNGYRLPFALFPTCDTGSFAADNCCRSEGFIRAENGGAIGAIGTATIGTHTRYNNCFFHGVWEGALNGSDHSLGAAMTRGKIELYNNYFGHEPESAEIWTVWNNLMGDPATDLWLAYPRRIIAEHPEGIPAIAGSVPVHVSDGLLLLEGALVSLYREGEFLATGYTDANGDVALPVDGLTAGELMVTVTMHNKRPYLGTLTVGATDPYPVLTAAAVDDDQTGASSGNGDGELNPGETVELTLSLTNGGASATGPVVGELTTTDPHVTLVSPMSGWGVIDPGQTVAGAVPQVISLAADTPDGHVTDLILRLEDGDETWSMLVPITVHSAAFVSEGIFWLGDGDTLDPGEAGDLRINLRNAGGRAAVSAVGTLNTDSVWLTVTDGPQSFGTIAPDAAFTALFGLTVDANAYGGHLAALELEFVYSDGQRDVVEFQLPVGAVGLHDPTGPDAYGYHAFDNTDTAWAEAPVYDWFEIDPLHDGPGDYVDLSDFSWGDDDVEIVNLPFIFKYYGQDFNRVSICSNGWIAMGDTPLVHFRNFSLPCAGSPNPLIAVFWDNLVQYGNGRVYSYHDEERHRFIVQWSRMRNCIDEMVDEEQTCQVILYDPVWHPTPTGDGLIAMQYHTVSNTDYLNGYATVGLQNLDGTDGLLYTYANNYAPGASPLAPGRAILYMPMSVHDLGTLRGVVNNASNGGSPVFGAEIEIQEMGRTLISTTNGEYIGRVSEGVYTLHVTHESFEPVSVSGVSVTEGEITVRDFALTDILGPAIENTTPLPYTDDTVGPYVVDTWITDLSTVAAATLRYKLNGSAAQEMPLTTVDAETGHFRAELYGLPLGSRVEYWIECGDNVGNVSRDPATPDTSYEFRVLSELVGFTDDMESDQGWTVGDTDDTATTGIWTRGEPYGTYVGYDPVQPETDVSDPGTLCWVTGNAGSVNQGVDDIDGGKTTLFSPLFDLDGGVNVRVSYYRWFTNNTGDYPGEDPWVVSVSGDGVEWVDLENTTTTDRSWRLMSFIVDDYIELTNRVRFRFVAQDINEGSIVEAALDEFSLTGFLDQDPTGIIDGPPPASVTLLPNMPNPFNPTTEIRFGLPERGRVDLKVFDAAGRLVRTLIAGRDLDAGFHAETWNGRDDRGRRAGSGLYFYVLSTDHETLSGKMTLLK